MAHYNVENHSTKKQEVYCVVTMQLFIIFNAHCVFLVIVLIKCVFNGKKKPDLLLYLIQWLHFETKSHFIYEQK